MDSVWISYKAAEVAAVQDIFMGELAFNFLY